MVNQKNYILLLLGTLVLVIMGVAFVFVLSNKSPIHVIHVGAPIYTLAFSPDGKQLLIGGENGFLQVYDSFTGQIIEELQDQNSSVFAVAFSPDGKRFATGGFDGSIKIWNNNQQRRIPPIAVRVPKNGVYTEFGESNSQIRSPIFDIEFSPNGEYIAAGGMNGVVSIIRSTTGEVVHVLQGHKFTSYMSVSSVTFRDDSTVLSAGADGTVHMWRISDGTLLSVLGSSQLREPISSISLLADKLYIFRKSGTLEMWSLRTRSLINTLQLPEKNVQRAVLILHDPNVSFATSAGIRGDILDDLVFLRNTNVQVFRNNSKVTLSTETLRCHSDYVQELDFSVTTMLLATGSSDGSVCVWSVGS